MGNTMLLCCPLFAGGTALTNRSTVSPSPLLGLFGGWGSTTSTRLGSDVGGTFSAVAVPIK